MERKTIAERLYDTASHGIFGGDGLIIEGPRISDGGMSVTTVMFDNGDAVRTILTSCLLIPKNRQRTSTRDERRAVFGIGRNPFRRCWKRRPVAKVQKV